MKKPLGERPGEAAAAPPRSLPALRKKQTHRHQSSLTYPMEPLTQTAILELFPDTAGVEAGELLLGGVRAGDLLADHGSPLVVYDEATLRAQAAAYRAAAPGALVCYGTKAFPSLALLELFADEGLGADVA